MTTARFYVTRTALDKGRLSLEGADHHHLSRVLRMRPGSRVQLLDGEGTICSGTVLEVGTDRTLIETGEALHVREERPRMYLYQALTRAKKMDEVVERAVELGAAAVVPFACERSRPLDPALEGRTERWRKLALEASRVAGRPYLPKVERARGWEEALRELALMGAALFADEAGGLRPRDALADEVPEEVGLMIGPEGGFSGQERAMLKEAGARPVTLGATVLRTETAGLVLLAAVRCRYGLL